MNSTSLNISGKIEPDQIALYQYVLEATAQLHIPFVVIGATARDIVLHHGYGATIYRATGDIDFGIQVANWSAFEALKQCLLDKGFSTTKTQYRIISPQKIIIDIVPFGLLEDENATIAWPPNGDSVMSVLGFQEACDNAQMVRIHDKPPIDIPVATPQCMALLKLIAWMERTCDLRNKDAKDLLYLFSHYEKISTIHDALYQDQTLMEKYDHDITLASAHQLGIDTKHIAAEKTAMVIINFFKGQHKSLSVEQLIDEMCERTGQDFQRNKTLTDAFIEGFLG